MKDQEREGEIEWIVALPDAVGGGFNGGYVHTHRRPPPLCESLLFILVGSLELIFDHSLGVH